MTTIDRLRVWVPGRPAPQGSKHHGAHGQMREASPYLPAWRAAVKRAVYEVYRERGIVPDDLPLFVGAVGISVIFYLDTGQRIDSEPDGDKLTRAVWDALTNARVWEDDGRVVRWHGMKVQAGALAGEAAQTGASIEVWPVAL